MSSDIKLDVKKIITDQLNLGLDKIEELSKIIQIELLAGEHEDFDKGYFDASMDTILEIVSRCKVQLNGGEK